jgi:hypothetical protein
VAAAEVVVANVGLNLCLALVVVVVADRALVVV